MVDLRHSSLCCRPDRARVHAANARRHPQQLLSTSRRHDEGGSRDTLRRPVARPIDRSAKRRHCLFLYLRARRSHPCGVGRRRGRHRCRIRRQAADLQQTLGLGPKFHAPQAPRESRLLDCQSDRVTSAKRTFWQNLLLFSHLVFDRNCLFRKMLRHSD